ncbi:acyltransferase family protein [Larkinella sp. VNQ87]|uniref:acyltransferase family protein n=1 Tax=Larkinella sp. VNQ87 TaxID=3400921 RepID=UPI003C076D92
MIVNAPKQYTLDALRGFAATVILLYHVIEYGTFLDPNYSPGFFRYFGSSNEGHLRVLLLFVISGTVITLSNQNFDQSKIITYLRKRFIRLYPIYVIGLIAALSFGFSHYSAFTIIGNFLFLDVLFTDVILENGPIWTLHYEILFYLLFIPIALVRVNPVVVFTTSITVGLVNFLVISKFLEIRIITSYCFGFAFWSLGMIIVRYFSSSRTLPDNYSSLLSYLFLILSIPGLNALKLWLYDLAYKHLTFPIEYPFDGNINNWFRSAFIFSDFSYLPYCFLAIILFSGYHFKGKNLILLSVQLLPLLYVYQILNKGESLDVDKMAVPSIFYGFSLIFFFAKSKLIERIARKVIKSFIWFGQISYGIYIIHIPILIAIHTISLFSGSAFSFFGRLVIYLAFTISASYFLERIFQPIIAASLTNKSVLAPKV